MGLFKKNLNACHSEKKRRREEQLSEFNNRQEEYDTIYKNEKQKRTFKSLLDKLKLETYTKRLVAIIISVCIIDLQLSYILAFLGKEQIAEKLSIQICITILGTALTYMIRAYFDTKAEKRDEMIKSGLIVDKRKSYTNNNEIAENKTKEVIDSTGLRKSGTFITPKYNVENPDDIK
jgi:uncharacterized membrane protein (DUF485 family)